MSFAVPDERARGDQAFVQTQSCPRIRQLQKEIAFAQTQFWIPQFWRIEPPSTYTTEVFAHFSTVEQITVSANLCFFERNTFNALGLFQ